MCIPLRMDLPYRIELFGDEVDSTTQLDPGSQLSVESLLNVSLMPNVQTRLVRKSASLPGFYSFQHVYLDQRFSTYPQCSPKIVRKSELKF